MKKKRLNNTLYLEERLKWFEKEKRFCYIYNEDGALFSGVYRTKIYPSDLPEWYIRGQYYRQFGYLSTIGLWRRDNQHSARSKSVFSLRYFSNHFTDKAEVTDLSGTSI